MESSVASERADQMTDASSEAPPLHLAGLLGGDQSQSSEYAAISLSEAPSSGNDEFARWPEEVVGNAQPEPVTGGVVREDHDLSVDVKTLMIGPGPLLYGRHRRIDYANAAFHRLAVHMHHIFNGMDRRFQFHREGAPYPRLIIGARRAAYAFDLMSVESVLTQLVHSGKIELYWVPVEEISPRKAHVVRLREKDAPRTSGVSPRNMPAHKAHKWPRTHAPFRANSTASHLHTRLNMPSCAMPFCEIPQRRRRRRVGTTRTPSHRTSKRARPALRSGVTARYPPPRHQQIRAVPGQPRTPRGARAVRRALHTPRRATQHSAQRRLRLARLVHASAFSQYGRAEAPRLLRFLQ